MKYHDMIIENFYALLNNIIEKEYISKRGLFTPKCRSPPFLFWLFVKFGAWEKFTLEI